MTSISATPTDATAPTAPARIGAARVGLLVLLMIVSIALPFTFLPMEASWGHLVFHLLGIIVCVGAVLHLATIRRLGGSRAIRVLTWIASATFALWLVGHIGELAVVLANGGAHASHAVFENPTHVFFATIAVPAWMLSMLTTLVLLIVIGVRRLRRR